MSSLVDLEDAQGEPELRAALRSPHGPHPAAHGLDQAATDEQPDPGAGDRSSAVGVAVEQVEDPAQRRVRDPGAVVGDPDLDLIASFRRASTTTRVPAGVYLAALPRRFAHDLLDVGRLAGDDRQVRLEPGLDL